MNNVNNHPILKEGRLTKRGSGYPYTWRERIFTLTNVGLSYATLERVGKGSFPLNKATIVTAMAQADVPGKKSPYTFKMSTGLEDLYMFAKSDLERTEWMDAIVHAVNAVIANTHTSLPVRPGETTIESLIRRVDSHKAIVGQKRKTRATERDYFLSMAQKKEMNLCSEENAETLNLSRQLAGLKVTEYTASLEKLKAIETRLVDKKKSLESEGNPNENEVSINTAEIAKFNIDIQSLSDTAVACADDHASCEIRYTAARSASQAATEAAEAAETEAARLREEADRLVAKEQQCKIDYEVSAMLATAPWTAEFKEAIDIKLNTRAQRGKADRRLEFAKNKGRSSSFINIVNAGHKVSSLIDLEKAHKVEKKMGTDHNFYDRYIWVNDDTGCFHWSKHSNVNASSKSIHIKTCIKTVLLCRPPKGSAWIGFSLNFFSSLDSSSFPNARGISAKDECIDIKVVGEDATEYVEAMCKRIIDIIKASNENITPPRQRIVGTRLDKDVRAV